MMCLARMTRVGLLATALVASWGVWCAPPATAEEAPAISHFLLGGDTTKAITMTTVGTGMVRVFGKDWEGVGLTGGSFYWGVFRAQDANGRVESKGTHKGTFRPDGSIAIHGEYTEGHVGSFDVLWKRVPVEKGRPTPSTVPPPGAIDSPPALPALDEYVYVEELPEAITKVPPVYPENAPRVEGTVMVQALVGKDGRVKDTRIMRSIPMLDEAAVAAVRQWVFKPAMARGSPVAVWVSIPVKFTLH
jgi:TonB family protein